MLSSILVVGKFHVAVIAVISVIIQMLRFNVVHSIIFVFENCPANVLKGPVALFYVFLAFLSWQHLQDQEAAKKNLQIRSWLILQILGLVFQF